MVAGMFRDNFARFLPDVAPEVAAAARASDVRAATGGHVDEAVIGLEIHAQLLTETKIFCGCPTSWRRRTRVCPVRLGLPGALPVLNRRAVDLAARGLALAAASTAVDLRAEELLYPDLPKGYQISQ
jgi:Asp-tRNA(Asn)/Glu-tRNA(Gln) amidotransferase B subunit